MLERWIFSKRRWFITTVQESLQRNSWRFWLWVEFWDNSKKVSVSGIYSSSRVIVPKTAGGWGYRLGGEGDINPECGVPTFKAGLQDENQSQFDKKTEGDYQGIEGG